METLQQQGLGQPEEAWSSQQRLVGRGRRREGGCHLAGAAYYNHFSVLKIMEKSRRWESPVALRWSSPCLRWVFLGIVLEDQP